MSQHTVVTIGVFDGVHRGHSALLDTTLGLASTEGMRSAVVTFHPHPKSVVRGLDMPLLATVARRSRLLEQRGIEHVHVVDFDVARSQQAPEVDRGFGHPRRIASVDRVITGQRESLPRHRNHQSIRNEAVEAALPLQPVCPRTLQRRRRNRTIRIP